jgi:hypothetical protein
MDSNIVYRTDTVGNPAPLETGRYRSPGRLQPSGQQTLCRLGGNAHQPLDRRQQSDLRGQ